MNKEQTPQEKALEHFASIAELVEGLHSDDRFDVRIGEDPLSAQRIVGYKIQLTWGNPEYWLEGELDEHDKPETVRFYFRDWFTLSERIKLADLEEKTLLEYASQFYFGPAFDQSGS